jgi:uncharacterized membrane protein YdfJ with MMPL/SSD domain
MQFSAIRSRLKAFLTAAAAFSYGRPWVTLTAVLVLTLAAGAGAMRLSVNADLAALLPNSFDSVRNLELMKERFGGEGYVVVVAENADPEALIRFAEDFAPQAAALEEVRYVEYRRPATFFSERALYFLDTAEIAKIADQVDARIAWEKRNHNPLYIDLEGEPAPSLELSNVLTGSGNDKVWLQKQMGERYYLDREKRILALLLKPASMASNFEYATRVVDQVQELVDKSDLTQYAPGMTVSLTGRYKKKVDQSRHIQENLRVATGLALVLVLGYFLLHFRNLRAVVLVFVPLVVSLIWGYGFAGMLFGRLNILTGFMGAILLGLGIDHGIHYLSRYFEEKKKGLSDAVSVQNTFGETGRAVMVSASTTVAAFLAVGLSEFRAFREFGIITAAGIVFAVAAYAIMLPALLRLMPTQPPANLMAHRGGHRLASLLLRRPKVVAGFTALLLLAGVFQFTNLKFNYDFSALEDSSLPSYLLDKKVNALLGYSQSPTVVLTDSMDEERAVSEALRTRMKEFGDQSTIDFVASVADMVPENQEAKTAEIARLGELLQQINPRMLEPAQRRQLKEAKRMTETPPFTRDELPIEVRRQFEGVYTGSGSGFVLIFPSISQSDGKRVRDFATEVRGAKVDGELKASGEALIMADILNMIADEGPVILTGSVLVIALLLLVLLGNVKAAALALIAPCVTLLALFGWLPAVGLSLNYLNIVLIPVLFGTGEDAGVHLLERVNEGTPLPEAVVEVGGAVAGSLLTTAMGFGAMLVADHSGLRSFGEFAVFGIALNLYISLVGLPAFLALLQRRRANGNDGKPGDKEELCVS